MPNLKITQIRRVHGRLEKQKLVMKGLGLKRIRHTVVREDNDNVRGMLFLISHLVTVEPTEAAISPALRTDFSPARIWVIVLP